MYTKRSAGLTLLFAVTLASSKHEKNDFVMRAATGDVPCAFAVVTEKMGNITFECPDGWTIDGPDCYLLVDVAMTYDDAMETCEKYGSGLVHIRDEVEAMAVGMMAHDRGMSDWGLYWIANNQTDIEGVCGGFWDVGQPKDVNASSPFYVAATAPMGRWQETDKATRLPFVCRTEACVEGTFRCRDGKKCISNKWLCDGEYDCDDQSDESDCDSKCMFYKYESSGTLDQNACYGAGKTSTWVIEGTEPGKPISIEFTSVNVEADVDYVEVWTGGPSLMTSKLQERLTGSLANKKVYGYNNFIIIRLVAGLSASGTGFVATWAPDDELSLMERKVEATDTWTELTSPHYGSDPLPCAFVRHYTVTTEEGSLITMEVMENELGEGFEYDPKTLSLVGGFGIFPDTYVSRSNMFSFYLVSNGCEGSEKFKARVKKGCSAEFSRANSFVTSPNAPPLHYPPSVTCTYTIRAPLGEERAFQLKFTISELADEKDSVKVYDGANNGSTELTPTGGYNGTNQAPDTPFLSTGPVVFVVFTSSLVQTNGFFYLSYNLACPAITNSDNMKMSSNDTHYESEVTLSCGTGFAFEQEEFASVTEVGIRCGLQGKWNVSRLPSCKMIYCGVPEAIPNGYISEGSGNARYEDTVTYQCFQGFTMTGSNTSTCGDGSMWSARPTCQASQCPLLDPLVNGMKPIVTGSGTGFGTITNYTCNEGFDLVGSRYTLCQTNGNWSHPPPTCERIKCPIPDVHRAVLSPMDPVDFESSLTVTCNGGFVINGTSDQSKVFSCLSSGTFDFRPDVCVDKDECNVSSQCAVHQECQNTVGSFKCVCEDKYREVNGACEVIDRCADKTSGCDSERGFCNASASKEDFTCDCKSGYILFTSDGVSGRNILSPEDGMTPGDVYYLNHTCVPKTCGSPPDVTNAQKLTIQTTHDFGDTVQYRCNFGYSISGTNPLMCNESGQWHTPPPSCMINECEALAATGLVSNIYPNSTTNPGDTVVLECSSDATDVPYNKTLFCEYDKGTNSFTLQGDKPHCPAVDCGVLTPMGGANFTVTDKGLGATFTFACQDGFVLEGTSTMGNTEVTCQKNGRWGLGNLTCNGERCMDPGTPGGMAQVSANFEVGGVVVYNCSRDGFMPDPMNRTCEYNTTSRSVYWDSSEPVCKDMAPPSFTNCPTETIFVRPYQTAGSVMTMTPSAQDNSGLVTVDVMPSWFSRDVTLPPGQYNVTYTASDDEGNEAACDFTIEVNDPGVLPMLNCPDYLTLEVNDSMSYTVNLKDHVSTDSGVTLSYSPAGHEAVMVGPNTVGKTPVRVTATDKFGFQRQCAFIVDIKPNKCLESYISSGLQNATKSCTGTGGNLSCTVSCNDGFAFQSGATSMSYSCSGANEWSPSLPVEACVVTVVPEYTFEVMVEYRGVIDIQECDIEARLREHIPTQEILCFYKLSDGTDNQMTFRVTNVEFFDINLDVLFANVSLGLNVDPPPTKKADLDACALRMSTPANIAEMFNLTGVTCPSRSDVNFPPTGTQLVNNGQSCGAGMTQTKVDTVDKCVQCAPGNFYQESGASCEVCPDGDYQSEAGQTQCNDCSDGGQYSAQPRSSQEQCIAPCPLGFFNGVGQTQDADVQCIACPVDHYLDTLFAANCTQCPDGKTTSGVEGATDVGACIDKCGAGQYPVNNTQCAQCPRGYFKPSDGNGKCDACDMTKTTDSVGSTSMSDCVDVTLAECLNGGTATADYHKTYCACPQGYTGNMCQDMVNACESNPCYNGGTCKSTGPKTFSCECQSNQLCDMVPVDIAYIANKHTPLETHFNIEQAECKSLCINSTTCAAAMHYVSSPNTKACYLYNATEYTNGTKLANWETFLKSCAKTFLFEGSRCEKDLTDDCTNATCTERSFCRDMVGSADCVCPSDSKYNGPSCQIDESVCDPNPCDNGGTCEDSGSGVRATCVCPPGFTGDTCEKDIDECEENPDGCLYGGQCTDAVNSYSCQCGDYSGDHCEDKPDFCTNNPTFCKNGRCYNDYNISSLVCVCEFPYKLGDGGQCEEIDICMENNPCVNNSTCNRASPGVTSCQCMEGYTGSRCQHNINDCESMPCTNGMCMDRVNNYTCQCDSGFTFNGTNCVNIDDCGNCSSTHTDTCEDLVNDYRCVCKVGFKGKDCEINIDECLSMPCQHNGSCTQSPTPGQYNCSCVDGWTGHNCEKLDEFCTSDLCKSGGTCYSLQDEYFCDCVGGSSGTNCEESRDVCSILNPCSPNIQCQDADGTAKCPCPTNYTGSSCNLIEDSCSNSPCQNGGTCMLNDLGHTCHCAEGFSGTNCTTASSACDSVTCPSGSTCVEVLKEAVCLCGAQKLKSGDSCKNASNDFDMYFARRGKAVRSIQPVKRTKDVMTVMFWLAPMVNTTQAPVQLKLSNGSNVLSVFLGSVMFGDGAPVDFLTKFGDSEQSFDRNTWNQFSVTWDATSYEMYLGGIQLKGGTHDIAFPPQNEFMFIYIGEDFEGYVSQLAVWERRVDFNEVLTMYDAPKTPSTEDLLLGWSGYRMTDNLWARVITPSSVDTGETVCEPGRTDCTAGRPDTDPLAVPNCPQDKDTTTSRLVQVNDLFDGEDLMSNIDGTLLTFGAHRLVFLKKDSHGNAGFCRFTAYVRREDRGRAQSCDVIDGLDASLIASCGSGNKGRKVQCSQGSVAPLSPKVLTCGKLGSYNLHNPDRRPAAVVCGATSSFKFKVTITLRYQLSADCSSQAEQAVANALKAKVKDLDAKWFGLCPDSTCANADTSDVKCQSSNSRMVDVMIVLKNVAAKLTKGNTTLTAKEVLETATKESDPSAFAIPSAFNAQLETNDAVIDAKPTCDEGQGLHDGVCVVCTKGSFLNETSEMCQLCPVGSYTSMDKETQCTQCPTGTTTLQLGADAIEDCVEECEAGTSYNRDNQKCEPCPKNFYNNKTGQEFCTPCPAGKATEAEGATMLGLCFDTCPAGTQLNGSDCVPCSRGKYSDGVEHETCVSCPVGNTTANTGSTSLSSCHQTACDPGNYRDSGTNMCMECDYGTYQPEKWQDMCMPCNTSYTTENKGSTSAEQCMFVCEAGTENLSGTMCSPCKMGFYRDDSVEQRFMNCTACNDTFTTEGESSDSADDCKIRICNEGSYRNETDNECYQCPMGEYQPDKLQTSCLACPRNLTTKQEGSDNMTQCVFYCAEGYQVMSADSETCQACERGKYKTNEGVAKFGMCQSCPVDKFTDDEASVSAADCSIPKCEAGQKIKGNGCENCPVNTYQPEANPKNSTDCMPCSSDTGTKEDKRTSLTDCLPVCDAGNQYNMTMMSCQLCPLGTFNTGNDTQRFEQCEACPAGYVTVDEMMGATSIDNCTLLDCPAGKYISGSDCLPCPAGTYQDKPRQTTCTPCRVNTNTSGDGKAAESECTKFCPTGQEEAIDGSELCMPCREDRVKETPGAGTCNQCTGNFTANDARTDCDVLFCDKGFKYNDVGPTCDPCEVGQYKDMRINATECMACPTNTTTAGVASTSVGDCNKANCDKGFYSSDGTLPCLACPVGKYKNVTGNMGCTDCTAGFTTASVASTDLNNCSLNICPVGQYRDMANQCVNCSVGSYQNETGQTKCMNCTTGYTTVGTGADNQDDCKIECSAGSYRNDTTNMCEQCPVGQYQESEGQTECSMCSADYTTAAAGSNSSTDCYVICPSGSAATARDSCEKCPHGQYQSADNANACKACESGQTTLETGATAVEQCQPICSSGQYLNKTSRMCMPCPLGTYNGDAGTNTTAVTECTACPEGNTTSNTGAETLSSCSIADCLAGSFRSSNGGCQECEIGTYQPEKSQMSCIPCDSGNTTLLPGRDDSKYCVLACPIGEQYTQASGTCVKCKVGFYRNASNTDCIKCPENTTTLTQGKDSCLPVVQGTEPPAPRDFKIVVRVKIRLRVKPCGTTSINTQQLVAVIERFILQVLDMLDQRFPAICKSSGNQNCVNIKFNIRVGCLKNLSSRRKRQTAGPEENEVEIEVSGIDSEVEDNKTGQIHDAAVAIERAFYDSQVQEKELNNNEIEFLGVDNVTSVYEPEVGNGPLKSDGTPAGSVDSVSASASGFTYGPCPNGTYSSDGTGCVSCAMNTYQDETGKPSCKDCPDKTFTNSTGAKAESQCGKKCDENDADTKYCSGQGSCSYDPLTSDGVRCLCKEGFEGNTCKSREAPTSDKTTMVAGIAGGAGAFLVLLVIIVGIVACLRNKAKKGKKESSEGTESKQVYDNEAYVDYAHPMFASPSSRALPGQPSLVYYNPEAYDQEVRDFYQTGRSTGPPSRQRSRSYTDEWNDLPDVL